MEDQNPISIANYGNQHVKDGNYQRIIQCIAEAIILDSNQELKNNQDIIILLNRVKCYIQMNMLHIALLDIEDIISRFSSETDPVSKDQCYFIRSQVWKQLAEKDQNTYRSLRPAMEIQECTSFANETSTKNHDGQNEESLIQKLREYNLSEKTIDKIKPNLHLLDPDNVPTNILNYKGLIVKNIRSDNIHDLMKQSFSLFGDIESIERLDRFIWKINYFNPAAPMLTIGYYQKKIFKHLCKINQSSGQTNSTCTDDDCDHHYEPLILAFFPGEGQLNLQSIQPWFHRECYYWRTTHCYSGDQCPKLHIPANKKVDQKIWMNMNSSIPSFNHLK